MPTDRPPVARVRSGGTDFEVWAPFAERVDLHIVSPFDKVVTMDRAEHGYHRLRVDDAEAGTRYLYRVGSDERPDPASRFQPEGVHGPSEVVHLTAPDRWNPPRLRDLVIYEAHIGTLTPGGTFDAAIGVLDHLASVGINALEVMPIAQFPGARNWGYDGVYPYAPQDSYGGPAGFRRLVDAAHERGIAIVLDVVYNHLGPEGCYLDAFGPYFTDRYATPWGRAINFDGAGSDEVRRYFIGNALQWFEDYGVDALRLDAVHAIADPSAYPFIEELADATAALSERLGRPFSLIAESASNDTRIVTPKDRGGIGLDAQWNDDFHHALYALVTGDRHGYFADYGAHGDLARAIGEGFVYQGEHSVFRGRRHGRPSTDVEPQRFVIFGTNHDQIGNRAQGDRLSTRIDAHDLRLMAATVLLAPGIPLLFMGEEYGETAPFAYFVSHSDPGLVEAVRRGRAEEFAGFEWSDDVPDPQAQETFERSKIDLSKAGDGANAQLLELNRELIRLRRELAIADVASREASASDEVVTWAMRTPTGAVTVVANLGSDPAAVDVPPADVILDTDDPRWDGAGGSRVDGKTLTVAPRSVVAIRVKA